MTIHAAAIALLAGSVLAQPATSTSQQPNAAGQQSASTAQGQNQPAGQAGAGQGAAGQTQVQAGPRPKSQAELQALQALIPELQNNASNPAKVDTDIQNFVVKFPDSDFKEAVYTLGLGFFRAHNDQVKALQYGEMALKVNPNDIAALVTLGGAIPQQVKETDLDRDERLAQAEGYDKRALNLADRLPQSINGHQLTPDQQEQYKKMIRASAHSSLALIAYDRKQYQQSVAEYQQAIPLDEPTNAAIDYYRMAQAQEGLNQYPEATASLDKAQQLGSNNSALMTLVGVERQKIGRATGKPVASGAPSTPAPAQPSASVPHP